MTAMTSESRGKTSSVSSESLWNVQTMSKGQQQQQQQQHRSMHYRRSKSSSTLRGEGSRRAAARRFRRQERLNQRNSLNEPNNNNIEDDNTTSTLSSLNSLSSSSAAAEAAVSMGVTLSSDQAFIDVILHSLDPTTLFTANPLFFEIKGIRKSVQNGTSNNSSKNTTTTTSSTTMKNGNRLQITYQHTLLYRGQPIWMLETVSCCDGRNVWGVTSSCAISNDGQLRVILTIKEKEENDDDTSNKTSDSPITGQRQKQKQNSPLKRDRERIEYSLAELLQNSATRRQMEMDGGM